MDYFGANQAYFVRPRIDYHAKAIAPKMGLRVLEENDLATLEKSLDAGALRLPLDDWNLQESIDELWGIDVPEGQKPTSEQLATKQVYSYLSYAYWYVEPYRNLLTLTGHFEKIAPLLKPGDPRHTLLAYVGAERFGYALLEMVGFIQSQGGNDVVRNARAYLYGGALALKEKEQFFELLRRATGSQESLDFPALPQILELTNRLIRNPGGASDILRHISAAYLWCAHLRNASLPNLGNPGQVNTPAIVLAKDVCETFAKVCGLPEALFQAMKSL